jgi:hypothetical protein
VGAGTTVRVHLPLPVAEENSSMNSRIGA